MDDLKHTEKERLVELKLKPISPDSIAAAIQKAELYRFLNEPEEAESICRDILAVESDNQVALRLLGLAITDQFTGGPTDRYSEVEAIFDKLTDLYEQLYCKGLLYERRAKAQMRLGRLPQVLMPLFQDAMRYFNEAEKIRPTGNDEAKLRWNRCLRLVQSLPGAEWEQEPAFETGDSPPVSLRLVTRGKNARSGR
jgi:tetratricopeptide (TPR) repeat protein